MMLKVVKQLVHLALIEKAHLAMVMKWWMIGERCMVKINEEEE